MEILIGIIIGFFVGFLISRRKVSSLEKEEARLQEGLKRIPELESELDKAREDLKINLDEINKFSAEIATLETTLEKEREHHQEKLKSFEKIEQNFQEKFENLANKILDSKSKKFTEQNQENLNTLLSPLKEKITTFEKQVESTHKDTIKENAALKQLVEDLTKLNQKISEDAENLTEALRGENKTQGNWGEMILEKVLENSGLHEGREYITQTALIDEEGRRMLPDVIVKLPEEKNIIIDSKVSLVAYERFCSAENKDEKESALKDHVLSMKSHVKNLSEKKYQKLDIKTPDFVLLFIPIEGAFSAALQAQPDLLIEASSKNIMFVSPTTLMTTLKTIRYIWQQEDQNRNAAEIAKQSGNLYDKFVSFYDNMKKIGERINQTQKEYDKALNKLESGNGNLIRKAENLKKLGAKTSKSLPPKVLEENDVINVETK